MQLASASAILGSAGPVAAALSAGDFEYEPRPEQLRMAESVAVAMDQHSTLLVEAGTGVGKSFAYLVPAIIRCVLHGERVVVATATISLQEQLIKKDLPVLMESLPRWGLARPDGQPLSPLVPVLAKGRGNYMSIRRLQLASKRQDRLLDAEQRSSLHVIEDWAYKTTDGSLSTLPQLERPDVWDHVRSDSDNCMGRKCPNFKECFYQEARRKIEKANLIVCNHALLFSDLALRSRGIAGASVLPPYQHLILDEAHNVEDSASDHFGLSLTHARVGRLLRALYQPRKNKGYLLERSLNLADAKVVERAIALCESADNASRVFFDDLHAYFIANRGASGRMRRPGAVDNPLTPAMRELAIRLRSMRDSIESDQDRFELNSYARRASEIADTAEALTDQAIENAVYWVECTDLNSRFGPRVTFSCAPIDVGPVLRACLFKPAAPDAVRVIPPPDAGDAFDAQYAETDAASDERASAAGSEDGPPARGIILTSATLATRTRREGEHSEHAEMAFAHVMNNLGIDEARTLQLGSPFDYGRQAKVIIDLSVPNPRAGDDQGAGRGYLAALGDRIRHHVMSTRGGAFVLFTSFSTLYAAAELLRESLEDQGLLVLLHGKDGSRQHILGQFVEHPGAVLFGCASFWQGVDVRGERLRNVIITRLPFEPPDRPLTQARIERIESAGGNPFMEESLPRAIIRFKQGFGRLIRSRGDTGRVVVLDPRIRTARYGKLFLDALPEGVPIEEQRPDEFEW